MTYRIRFHPAVADDLASIAELIANYAGPKAAERRLSKIEAVINSLADTPLKGSVRAQIAPDLRAIPAERKAVVTFTVDEAGCEVLVHAISYAGSDCIVRSTERRR
jgi:toxin ParE1/3/4